MARPVVGIMPRDERTLGVMEHEARSWWETLTQAERITVALAYAGPDAGPDSTAPAVLQRRPFPGY